METRSRLLEHSGNMFPKDEVLIILFNTVVILPGNVWWNIEKVIENLKQ